MTRCSKFRRLPAPVLAASLALGLWTSTPAWAQLRAPVVGGPTADSAGQAPAPDGAATGTGANASLALGVGDQDSIVAVVNGDVISRGDVENRRRLFALSAGLPPNPEVLARLTPQITKQLINEKLRLQEIRRRRISVGSQEIARAIGELETRNGLPAGELRKRLAADGVELRTLVDQVRVQIGWSRVLRQELGPRSHVNPADIADQEAQLKAQIGQPEYNVAEIFIPIDNPQNAAEAGKFADVVAGQLRQGAPFAVAAAQFSQDQTALAGGDLGWVRGDDVDPEVLRVLKEMPVGAVSNPIRVPGGMEIVTLRGTREVGHEVQTTLSVRQAFLPFTSTLNPQAPTEQQKQVLAEARKLSATATNCDAIEAAAKQSGSNRPSDPGPVVLESLSGPMRAALDKLQPGHASQPIVSEQGIAVLMVCSRDNASAALPSKQDLGERVLGDRIERVSRQLMQDLQRRAVIDQRV